MAEDLGTDAANSTLNISTKMLQTILELFEKVFERWDSRYERKEAKGKYQGDKAENEVNASSGEIAYRTLKKTGEPLKPMAISLSEENMKVFNECCAREGAVCAWIKGDKDSDGKYQYYGVYLERQESAIQRASESYTKKIAVRGLNEKINALKKKNKEEGLTSKEKLDLENLRLQKYKIQYDNCEKLNNESWTRTQTSSFDESKLEPLNLETAINRFTGSDYDNEIESIIADSNDPSRYIKCRGVNDKDGKSAMEFEIYNNNELVKKFDDRDTRDDPDPYFKKWRQRRKEICDTADFSGTCYKFMTKEEYNKWSDFVKQQNQDELDFENTKFEDRDFAKINERLENKLRENGFEQREDGKVYDRETGKLAKEFKDNESVSKEKRMLAAESVVIGNQITLYKRMSTLKSELVMSQVKDNAPEIVQSEQDIRDRISEANVEEQNLLSKRKAINAEQGHENNEKGRDKDKDKDDKDFTKEKVGKELSGKEKQKDKVKPAKDTENRGR